MAQVSGEREGIDIVRLRPAVQGRCGKIPW